MHPSQHKTGESRTVIVDLAYLENTYDLLDTCSILLPLPTFLLHELEQGSGHLTL